MPAPPEAERPHPGPPRFEAFPREERLRRKQDFDAVFQTGRKVVGRAFVLYVARREGQGRRFGCAVSRRVGKAVVRNRVKRRLREFHRTHRHLLPEDAWLVAVARPAAAELTHDQCRATLTELYERGNRAWAESR